MWQAAVIVACIFVCLFGLSLIPPSEGVPGILLVIALAGPIVLFLRVLTDERRFITLVFLTGLALRIGFGILVHVYEFREFFGGDALTYDFNGFRWMSVWLGHAQASQQLLYISDPRTGPGWGMYYFTGAIYFVFGRNIFVAQSICGVVGAATAPVTFFCSRRIFNNLSAAKAAAFGVAVFPAFVIWSSQLLKDGLIIFLLVLTMTLVLRIQSKLSYLSVGLLVLCLFGIFALRFYIFYMVVIAVAGSFVVGISSLQRSIVRNLVVVVAIGIGLAVLGVSESAQIGLERFADLERIQLSRSDLARAGSGFGEKVDVSTTEGAIAAIPLGVYYLMLAPFPWEATNLRQAITIPDVLAWWSLLPFLFLGLVYALKHRLRNAFPILIFTLLLTLSYAIFQGNVGTAYRQRTQLQVFFFILIGVGWVYFKERRENKRLEKLWIEQRLKQSLQARGLAQKS